MSNNNLIINAGTTAAMSGDQMEYGLIAGLSTPLPALSTEFTQITTGLNAVVRTRNDSTDDFQISDSNVKALHLHTDFTGKLMQGLGLGMEGFAGLRWTSYAPKKENGVSEPSVASHSKQILGLDYGAGMKVSALLGNTITFNWSLGALALGGTGTFKNHAGYYENVTLSLAL